MNITLRKIRQTNVWNTIVFKINNKVFSNNLFEKFLDQFWNKIESNFTDNNHLFILLKIKYVNNDYATIGNLQRLNLGDKIWYLNVILELMEFKSDYYKETQIESLIFSYGFKSGEAPIKSNENNNLNFQIYKDNRLPITTNIFDYGTVLTNTNIENGIKYILQNKKAEIIVIDKYDNYYNIEWFKNRVSLIKYRDNFISENKFVRIIKNNKFYFENNKEVLFLKEINTKFINKIAVSKNLTNKFLTIDIETYIKNNILVPFCVSIYDGTKKSSFFILDYKNVEDMLISALKSILIRKYNGYKIYLHNLSKFDIIFLFKYLIKLGTVKPIIHNNRIISINLNYGENYHVQFKDSYLILLDSLLKLAKSFKVETQKSFFPYLFVNETNLDYVGKVPALKYFEKINRTTYNEYSSQFKNNWNLREQSIQYCEKDCISLYEVISKFSLMIFNLFSVNMHNYPTLPSLAFAIFRSNFLVENTIPQLSGKIASDIREGYTGGAVDMYIPTNKPGVKTYCYDVNALYPSQMFKQVMPVGNATYFKGDIRKENLNAFGFFYCKITAPDKIKHPILQTHVKTNNGIRTISPIGSWSDMLFSAEMDNASKLGYKFEILWGYTFEKANIFKEYVDTLHNIRKSYPKDDPMNYIAKILLNSLYGRFGMDDNFINVDLIHKDYFADFEAKFLDNIKNIENFDEYKLVQYKFEEIENQDSTHNISIGIAAAITAYSRIHMSFFKNNPNFNLFYTDTDSAYIDSPLADDLVDSKTLGKVKLENICKKAIFLAPKVYCLLTEEGKIIYKVKGLKHEVNLTLKEFKSLLNKDKFLMKEQTKWMRNLSDGNIKLNEQLYTLKVTDNKRELVYNSKGLLIGTKPYRIDSNKDIRKNINSSI
uniref:Probable DNA polymerase n=1 Tax=Russula compacta TaxID=40490 RepID=A0A2S0U3M5_9AGAM|nr:hypothetical protein [Russula compacta]AWB36087.1 hypothetical protein [Russula compacta]